MIFRITNKNWAEHQTAWWKLPNFYKFLVGGVGCGKTYIGALRAIYLSYVHKGLPGKYVSPSFRMAQETVIPTLLGILGNNGLEYTYNKSTHKIIIHNWNGHIWLGSGDDPKSLQGPNLAWGGIDEPFIQSKEVFEETDRRIRIGEVEYREIFLTGTPEELNWGYDICMNDAKNMDVGVVFGKTKDNKFVDDSFYDRLYHSYTPEMRQAYLDGKFINLREGKVYKPFDRNIHIQHKDVKGLEIRAGQDFNVDYMTTEVFAVGNGWIHFIDEVRLSHSNSFEASEALARKYPGIRIYCDPTGGARKTSASKTDHQIFHDAGFMVHHKNWKEQIPVKDRVNTVNKLLQNGHFTIEPGKCEWLVKDLERNIWDSGDINKKVEELTHAGDAVGYAIYYMFPVVKRVAYV